MRLAFASFFAATVFVLPLLSGAAPSPAPVPHILAPEIRLPVATSAPVTGPPVNPATTTLWLKPVVDHQVILSNINESMASQGSHGCMLFTISGTLNTADAVTVLGFYNKNEVMSEARLFVPGSVVYTFTNGVIKSYSESAHGSTSSATFTLTAQKVTAQSGSSSVTTPCEV